MEVLLLQCSWFSHVQLQRRTSDQLLAGILQLARGQQQLPHRNEELLWFTNSVSIFGLSQLYILWLFYSSSFVSVPLTFSFFLLTVIVDGVSHTVRENFHENVSEKTPDKIFWCTITDRQTILPVSAFLIEPLYRCICLTNQFSALAQCICFTVCIIWLNNAGKNVPCASHGQKLKRLVALYQWVTCFYESAVVWLKASLVVFPHNDQELCCWRRSVWS